MGLVCPPAPVAHRPTRVRKWSCLAVQLAAPHPRGGENPAGHVGTCASALCSLSREPRVQRECESAGGDWKNGDGLNFWYRFNEAGRAGQITVQAELEREVSDKQTDALPPIKPSIFRRRRQIHTHTHTQRVMHAWRGLRVTSQSRCGVCVRERSAGRTIVVALGLCGPARKSITDWLGAGWGLHSSAPPSGFAFLHAHPSCRMARQGK